MDKYAIIVAGGSGRRFNYNIPKQFVKLSGVPLLMHTINKFSGAIPELNIILVLPSAHIPLWHHLIKEFDFSVEHTLISGGKERFFSVKNGLSAINNTAKSIVSVHDGVRPLVSEQLIKTIYEKAILYKAVVPGIRLKESIRFCDPNNLTKTANRNKYRLIQTPQAFSLDLLKKAYEQPYTTNFTDDASVVEAYGKTITLIEGETTNIKITEPLDLIIAENVIKNNMPA